MRVIICGGRTYRNVPQFVRVLANFQRKFGAITEVLSGGATGADALAEMWALLKDVKLTIKRANWIAHGVSAGPIRNREMLKERPDYVIAFPGGSGTANMIHEAQKAGVKVLTVRRSPVTNLPKAAPQP